MTTVRRSTRLSSVGRSTPTPSAGSIQTPSRRSEVWRRRQTKHCTTSDEEEESTLSKSPTLAEIDKENTKTTNIMSKAKGKAQAKVKELNDVQEPKTPRRVKAVRTSTSCRTTPQAKKRGNQEQNNQSEDERDVEDSGQNVSPPKLARWKHKTELISPSRLIDRLSIDERKQIDSDEEDHHTPTKREKEETQVTPTRNKYQSARRVLNSAETQHLPGREQQLQELRDFFQEHLEEQRSGSLYVSGQPGTGKTACLSLLLRSSELSKQLQCVYINCTSIASINGVYKKLCTELKLHPAGRTERDYQAAVQQHLRTARRMLLIVLDEIDQLCSTKQSVLYTIFEWPSLPGARLLLVGIANSLDLTERTLMRLNARCELKPQHMHFPPYTKQQIVEIFRARLEEAGVLEVFPPVTLQLLAAKVSAVSGDVRRALDIGRRVAEIAEQQMKLGQKKINLDSLALGENDAEKTEEVVLKPVQVTQVAEVLNKVYGVSQNLQEDIEDSFPLQQKIVLCSLMLMLRKERNKDITIGRLHEVYRRVCVKRNIHALDQAEFAGLVDLIETRGILRIMRKKEPRLCKVVLQWDEEEVNGALRDKQLIASILDDTACLGNK
ncbi:cell division control protein 6 homolog [Bactrocera neohumeralis]|uniref:cell division control protein 6 homolog n=1 Tax=Bactrocera neohumeralis TaxID=98809 RepID=UPI002164F320|nr:cell division control protein 6 homolog [Bactrocera neohumeralis]XP_050335107.1 cell division control protein 6 homolog [Bactrocera neohumeralis]